MVTRNIDKFFKKCSSLGSGDTSTGGENYNSHISYISDFIDFDSLGMIQNFTA